MTIFDYLNSILFSKKKIELNCDDESQFSVFMVNRWSSFYAKDAAVYVNQTSNMYANLFNNKQEQFDFLYNVLPKLKYKRLDYIKKVKKEDVKDDTPIIPEFMSQREYLRNVELEKLVSK
jgi:hypothetical protein